MTGLAADRAELRNERSNLGRASLVAQLVKNPPAMWVQSLGCEDPLQKERLPTPVFWPAEFHGLYSPWGPRESDTTEQLSLSLSFQAEIHPH